ncbi:MAG: hypothetical protein CVV21_11965 [Candidatus Goldiibacteriota bacterium HGW-Goldbacteria-1]|nr:MAG: hypothetical protein CVV21_11965 [Candidatus Goldiibacteriota bacterium HGW-Goldbacteria-1]
MFQGVYLEFYSFLNALSGIWPRTGSTSTIIGSKYVFHKLKSKRPVRDLAPDRAFKIILLYQFLFF